MGVQFEQSEGRLQLRNRPPFTFAAFLILSAVLMQFLFGSNQIIQGQRQADGRADLVISDQTLGWNRGERRVKGVTAVRLETIVSLDDADQDTSYRLMFQGAEGKVPLSMASGWDWQQQENIRIALSNWLVQPPTGSITLHHGRNRWILPIGLALLFLAAALLWTGHSECRLDKFNNRVRIARRGLWRSVVIEHPLDEVQGFDVVASSNIPDDHGSQFYRVVMKLQSGESIPLSNFYTANFTQQYATAARLERFLTGAQRRVIPCAVCQQDCGLEPRFQDAQGRYYHRTCYRQKPPSPNVKC